MYLAYTGLGVSVMAYLAIGAVMVVSGLALRITGRKKK